jgi:transposase
MSAPRLSVVRMSLAGGMRGLVGAKAAAIDADVKRIVRVSDACRRLMTIPGVGQLAFTAAVDD